MGLSDFQPCFPPLSNFSSFLTVVLAAAGCWGRSTELIPRHQGEQLACLPALFFCLLWSDPPHLRLTIWKLAASAVNLKPICYTQHATTEEHRKITPSNSCAPAALTQCVFLLHTLLYIVYPAHLILHSMKNSVDIRLLKRAAIKLFSNMVGFVYFQSSRTQCFGSSAVPDV